MSVSKISFNPENSGDLDKEGPFRILEHEGRKGWHATSVNSRLKLPIDVNAMATGTVSLWLLPLEELSHRYPCADLRKAHPGTDFNNHLLISDHPDLQNVCDSRFALIWDPGWYPQYWAKFFKGYLYHDGFKPERKLLALSGHFSFERLRWYHLALSWDKLNGHCAIYVNGLKVGQSADDTPLAADPCGNALYAGNTAFALGEISIETVALDEETLSARYKQTVTDLDQQYMQSLRNMYHGENPQHLEFTPDNSWQTAMELPLNRPEDLRKFYVQGRTQAPSVTEDGLLVETGLDYPPMNRKVDDLEQVYLWTEDTFEGDLYVTYEYMPLKPGGLSLLLTQASGLRGEDFMVDYPRRTTGSMSMVCWENIRNYHWEYYREISDVPAKSASSGFTKNPWCTPLAYRRELKPTTKNTWHRLEFLQEGERIRGALDGVIQFDVTDSGFRGNGPVYRHGHIAIRCMFQTRMCFRNLRVLNRKPAFNIV